MKCPACHAVLITVEYQSIELDCCVACGGTWLDLGELELLADGAAVTLAGDDAPQPPAGIRKCPICSKRMGTFRTQTEPAVAYERCAAHGLWLDQGELEQVVARGGGSPGGARVDGYLRDVFGGKYRRE